MSIFVSDKCDTPKKVKMRQYLKPEVKQKLKDDEALQFKVAQAMDKKFRTVERWIKEDHVLLTTSTVLDVIRKHIGYKENEPLTLSGKELVPSV